MDLVFGPLESKVSGNIPTLANPFNTTWRCSRLNTFVHCRAEWSDEEPIGVNDNTEGVRPFHIVLVPTIDLVEIEHNNDRVGISGDIVLPHWGSIISRVSTQEWSEGWVCVINHSIDPTVKR